MDQKTIPTPFANFTLIDDGIVLLTFMRGGELEIPEAAEIIRITKELTNNGPHVLVYDFNKLSVYFTKEVRAMAQNRNPAEDHIVARAFVCYNLSNKLEVNHFIKYNKPEAVTELFSFLDKALEWSQEQKKNMIKS